MFDSTAQARGPLGSPRSDHENSAVVRLHRVRDRLLMEAAPVSGNAALSTSVHEVRDSVETLRSLDWPSLTSAETRDAVIELELLRRVLDGLFSSGLVRLESSGGAEAVAGLTLPGWLAQKTHGSRTTTKRLLAAGRTLARFTRFAVEVDRGELTPEHALVLHDAGNPRIVDQLLEAETTLLELALSCTVEQFRRGVRAIVTRIDTDGAEPDCGDRDELAMTTDSSGTLHLRGRFSGHNAVTVRQAIQDEMDRQLRATVNERRSGIPTPSPGVLRGRGMVPLIRNGLSSGMDTTAAPRTEAIIVLGPDGAVCDHHDEPLDPTTAAVLACDAFIHPIFTSADGSPLFAGRAARDATRAQRRALIVRDGGCVFPGCDAPASWCDAHHVVPWDSDGRTDMDNLVLLCRRHHRLAHRLDWSLTAVGEDEDPSVGHRRSRRRGRPAVHFVWSTPEGRTLPAQHAAGEEPQPDAGSPQVDHTMDCSSLYAKSP